MSRIARIATLIFATAACTGIGRTQGEVASWLDEATPAAWNAPGRSIPAAPRIEDAIDARCRETSRPPELEADERLRAQGWDPVGPYHGGWQVLVVQATAGYDGMCRPRQYQDFVFVRGVLAGTLSPVPMDSRADGALGQVFLQSGSRLTAEYARYLDKDPLCCPSRTTSVVFDIADVNKSASAINPDKLAWINQQHLVRLPPAKIVPELRWQLERLGVTGASDATLEAVVLAQRERSKTLKEMAEASRFFFEAPASYEEKAARKNLTPETAPIIERARSDLAALTDWTAATIHGAIQALAVAGGWGLGKVAQPIRVAVSGGSVSPPIDQTLAILGREETLKRLDRAAAHAKR